MCYSNDSQDDDYECPPHTDDSQYFDIDISFPFSPKDTTPISSSEDGDTEDEFYLDLSICSPDILYSNQCIDEFDLDLSICSPDSPNPNYSICHADNVFYQGQLLPLQVIPTPLEYGMDIKDTHDSLHSPRNPTGVKNLFPKLLKTATKLKLSFFGFRKSAKPGIDLPSPCVECATCMQQKLSSNYSDMGSEKKMRSREMQSAVQGAISHCKQSNYIH